jgi:transposase
VTNIADLESAAELDVFEGRSAVSLGAWLDNSSTHKTPDIHRWLLRHPRFTFHFTPTSSSWLNLVERWFAELTRKLLQRSAHRTVAALTADLDHWIETWNDDPKPFVWHKTADQILDGLKKYLTNL